MSKWSNSDTSTAREVRKARMDSIIAEMPEPQNPASNKPIPQWLVDEQEKLRNPRLTQVASSSSAQSSNPTVRTMPSADNDFIMVDLLDGAHMHTRPADSGTLAHVRMSATSDSIISLPPVDTPRTSTGSWHTMKRLEAQAARRDSRIIASADARFPSSTTRPPDPRANRNAPLRPTTTAAASDVTRVADLPVKTGFQKPPTAAAPPLPPHSQQMRNILPQNGPPVSGRTEREMRGTGTADAATPLQNGKPNHSRIGSYGWYDDETESWAPTVTTTARRNMRKNAVENGPNTFRPSEWAGGKPAEEDAIMPNAAWIYLALIGCLTFLIALSVNTISDVLAGRVIAPLANLIGAPFGPKCRMCVLAILRGASLATSFALVLKLSPHYGAGSGIPEMKCVLGGVLMPQMLNWRTLVAKMLGLIFSLASDISIGRLGPFIHMSCITASLVSQLPVFPSLRSNARYQLQALSAAMAAGVSATVGAPIGGTMLAIEIMSTYYYIHWLPMALYCSIMGYYFVVSFSSDMTQAYLLTTASVDLRRDSLGRLLVYFVLGVLCGALGAGLVHFTKAMFKFRQRFFKNSFPWRTVSMLVAFAAMHTIVTEGLGGVLSSPERQGVSWLFQTESPNSKQWLPVAPDLFSSEALNSGAALFIVMSIKFVLTGMSLVMPVPAGTFMPIFEIGALFGRGFGECWRTIPFFGWVDARTTAVVGAAALTSGVLHTVSVAVVMLELTREAVDVLPLAVGVIVSYGVSKRLCSDLFSEFVRIRRLPYILGLRERYPWETGQFFDDVASEVAGSFMNKNFPFVTPHSTRGDIYDMLTKGGKPWANCAFLSDRETRRLWGTVTQATLWSIVLEDMPVGARGSLDKPEYGSFDVSESGALRGLQTVPFLNEFDVDVGHPFVDMGPMQVGFHMAFWKIITLFRMLSMSQMYVMRNGAAVGVVSKADVINHSIRLEERAKRKRKQESHLLALQRRDQVTMAARWNDSGNSSRIGARPSQADLSVQRVLSGRQGSGTGHHSRQNSLNRAQGSKGW